MSDPAPPADLSERLLIDDCDVDVELMVPTKLDAPPRQPTFVSSASQTQEQECGTASPSTPTTTQEPSKKHDVALLLPAPRRPVRVGDLTRVMRDDDASADMKAAALFELAVHSAKGAKKYHKYSKRLDVPREVVQEAQARIDEYRMYRPHIYRHSYHTDMCDEHSCNGNLLSEHCLFFPCAVQGMYDAINDPGFTSCSVPCQALFCYPFTWPVFCCAQAYVLRSKLNLIFGVRESYHVFANSLFCPFCLTASMHREIERRGVPVTTSKMGVFAKRLYESEVFAPDIAHMGACGELVIPLPSLNDKSSKPSTLPPPMAEYGCCSLRASAPYNSLGHALLIALSAAPYLALTFALGPFALMYNACIGLCCSCDACICLCCNCDGGGGGVGGGGGGVGVGGGGGGGGGWSGGIGGLDSGDCDCGDC